MFHLDKHQIGAARFVLDRYQSEMESKEFVDEEEKEDVFENIRKSSANVDRAWGKYCLVMLQKSVDHIDEDQSEMAVENVDDFERDVASKASEFSTIVIDDTLKQIPEKLAKNFEEAREIFLPGQRYLNRSKEYFKFEEHCVDYTEINQDLSSLHKMLVVFETGT